MAFSPAVSPSFFLREKKEGPVLRPVATLSFDQGSKDLQLFASPAPS